MSRVVIIGAGVMGCACALELARRGVRDVIVLERAVPGAEASSAAAGMLAAQVEASDREDLLRFVAARRAYESWAADLRESTGIDIGYRRTGILETARDEDRLRALHERVALHQGEGLRAEVVDASSARAIERELAPSLAGAAWYPDEAQVDPPQLLRALVAAIARAGVIVRSGTTVSSIVHEGARFTGVALSHSNEPGSRDGRELLAADAVVLAAGSWSSLVPGVPADLPKVRPIRGQLVMLEERPPRLKTIVFGDHAYVVPRGDGRVICGSTMEDVGHRREVTAGGVHDILSAALAIAPGLRSAELGRAWCNFRPHTPGARRPLVGRSPVAGLFLATGHHRNGILLAKVTADEVASAILGS